ncbi:MAG: hypothetical protein ABSA76_03675 [Bacteroidales bacterium]
MISPASYRRILHKMGYYDYQQGLIYRHLNQGNGWQGHEKRCRDFIIKAADLYHPEKITVLGSGWLLELPLTELAERTRHICLIDIIHPPAVKDQVKKLKNVELSEQDISGGLIEKVWQKAGNRTFLNKLRSLEEIEVPEFRLEDPGTIISLNIMTQLEAMPLRILSKKARTGEADLFNFRKNIQESHLRFLKRHKSILITDTAEIFTDSSGNVSEVKTVITDLPEGIVQETWKWDFDLKGLDYSRKRSVMEVVAIIF